MSRGPADLLESCEICAVASARSFLAYKICPTKAREKAWLGWVKAGRRVRVAIVQAHEGSERPWLSSALEAWWEAIADREQAWALATVSEAEEEREAAREASEEAGRRKAELEAFQERQKEST